MKTKKPLAPIFKLLFLVIMMFMVGQASASPGFINLQSRISKPDGAGYVETSGVQFRFSITDPVGTCILFQEDFTNVDMTGSKGLVNFKVGTGTKTYPAGPMTMPSLFTNFGSPVFNCQSGGTYTAAATDSRKLVMQFNDGTGWQTVPSMEINSVPFALESLASQRLGSFPAADYVRTAQFTSCTGSQAVHFNGTNFTCVALSSGASYSAITGATAINAIDNTNFAQTWNWSTANTQNPMTMTANALTTGSLLNLTTTNNSLNSTNGLLNVANTGTSTSGTVARIQSNSAAGSGLTVLANGNVGIGLTNPGKSLDVSGTGRFSYQVLVGDASASGGAGYGYLYVRRNTGLTGDHNLVLDNVEFGANKSSSIEFRTGGSNYAAIGGGQDGSTAGVLTFATGGGGPVERMRIGPTGNVGIGTTNPIALLHISKDLAPAEYDGIVVQTSAANPAWNFPKIKGRSAAGTVAVPTQTVNGVLLSLEGDSYNDSNAFNVAAAIQIKTDGAQVWGSNPGRIDFLTMPTGSASYGSLQPRMSILNGGNVGIGTMNPGSLLDVASGNGTAILIGADQNATTRTDNTAKFGRIGAAHYANAEEPLAVVMGTSSALNNNIFIGGGVNQLNAATQVGFYTASNTTTLDGTLRMVIDSSGNVGVGTPTPGNLLTVHTSANNTTPFSVENAGNTSVANFNVSGGGHGSVNVGEFGGSIVGTLSAANGLTIKSIGAGSTVATINKIGDVYFAGNVGIGTTSPDSKLQVNGHVWPETTATSDLGSSSLRWNNIYLSNAPDVSSDARLKKEVKDSDLGLEFVNSLRPVSWIWKDAKQDRAQHYGVIAQEVEDAIAKAKGDDSSHVIVSHNKENDNYSVRYTELIAPLIKALQELHAKFLAVDRQIASVKAEAYARAENLEAQNAAILKENSELKSRLDRQEKELARIKKNLGL